MSEDGPVVHGKPNSLYSHLFIKLAQLCPCL